MKTNNIPFNANALLNWSVYIIKEPDKDSDNIYELRKVKLTELSKESGYEKYKVKLNKLYKNYSVQNYQLVWNDLQKFNEKRKQHLFQKAAIAEADKRLEKHVESLKLHFGEIPSWIDKLSDKQRDLLLARAKVCYGLEPEYKLCNVQTKTIYTLPERLIKDYNEYGEPYYYSKEELYKANYINQMYNDVVGNITITNQELRKLAEDAVIRDAAWMAKFNNTEFDLRNCREVEGDAEHNKMIPIENLQGLYDEGTEELKDFQEPLYADDDYTD